MKKPDPQTSVLVSSLALIAGGCSLAWLPLGPIVLGSLLLTGLIWTRLHVAPLDSDLPTEE